MSVSRRGFLTGTVLPFSGALIAARGHGGPSSRAGAGAAAHGRSCHPGVAEIRISSNENPLGPGKAALDAILGKFPEAGRYPFNSTPSDGALVAAIAGEVQGQAGERRARRRLAGDSEERDARVHVADRGLVTARADVRELHRRSRSGSDIPVAEVKVDSAIRLDVEAMIAAVEGRRARLLQQPEQSDRHRARREDGHRLGRARPAGIARHGDPDRRGVSRLRDRPVVPERGAAGARDAERLRRPDVLEGLRHGGHAHRLRDRHDRRR